VWDGYNWLRIKSSDGLCKHGKEPLGSIKGGEFLDQLGDDASWN
jgi:hypothetical protein